MCEEWGEIPFLGVPPLKRNGGRGGGYIFTDTAEKVQAFSWRCTSLAHTGTLPHGVSESHFSHPEDADGSDVTDLLCGCNEIIFFGKEYRKMPGIIFNKQEFSPNRAIWG